MQHQNVRSHSQTDSTWTLPQQQHSSRMGSSEGLRCPPASSYLTAEQVVRALVVTAARCKASSSQVAACVEALLMLLKLLAVSPE